ncbi:MULTISPECIES: DNA repair exonuclease [unclassified Enterococcus]|uniref:DNA repair exonuclease n=1 Tax=unclassified Enterococcus TaxID=2608891 RepID=UPI0013EA9737|nr:MULTISPECIES: DNA repair exonuclease [unclassified Enterococcus]
MVKFIHAADLHMDRSFEGLTILDENIQERLLKANLTVLSNIVDQAVMNHVDFVLFAGDNFHQNRPSLKIQKHFSEQMYRLKQKNIQVYMIFGNHDFYQRERYWFDFPDNVHLFTSESVETKKFSISSGETLAISGFSYCHPWIREEKVSEFPNRAAVDYHIGLYHGEVGTQMQGNYAPFLPSRMQEKGYDYWALGHIHVPMAMNESKNIVYPGAPQGHTQKEKTATSVLLVELSANQSQLKPLEVAEVYWKSQEVSLQHAKSTKDILDIVQQQLPAEMSKFNLIELKIKDYEHLSMEVVERIQTGELLDYLSEEITQFSSNLFVWRISIMNSESKTRIPLTASTKLMDQLFENYQIPQDFHQILHEAFGHQEAAKLLNDLPDYQEQTLEKAKELLKQDFLFEEARE